jgi:molybdenum cofactor biosynthesis enzyme MoaA
VDAVSVSLNTSDPEAYLRLNRPQFGRETYNEVINFIRGCKSAGLDVTATVVGFPDADIEGAHKFTEKLGVNFRVRKYNDLG